MDADFEYLNELVQALSAVEREPRPLWELVLPRGGIQEDLSPLPAAARYVATRGTAAHLDRLTAAPAMMAVWASPITDRLLRVLAELPSLRAVYLAKAGKADLTLLGALQGVEHLMLAQASSLRDLSWLGRLPRLRTLYLDGVRQVDLETLPALEDLAVLQLGGGMWSTLKVPTLAPLGRLTGLRYLGLANVRSADGSLRPLRVLHALRQLDLPNFFTVEEYAGLAGALPDARGRALTPFFTDPDRTPPPASRLFPCVICGGERIMLTGRPASILCPACDAAKIRKRVARWELARSAHEPGTSRK